MIKNYFFIVLPCILITHVTHTNPKSLFNFKGKGVPVLMYHIIDNQHTNILKDPVDYMMHVQPKEFEKHLHIMQAHHFQPISLDELVRQDFARVRPGWKPYVITFDDAWPVQFQLKKDAAGNILLNRQKQVIPTDDCAVGILEKFKKIEPTITATFYVSFATDPKIPAQTAPFGDSSDVKEKLLFLKNNGYTIGAHSCSHYNFAKTAANKAIKDIKCSINRLEKYVGKGTVRHFAWPYGKPTKEKAVQEYVEATFDSIAFAGIINHVTKLPIDPIHKKIPRICIHTMDNRYNKLLFLNNNTLFIKKD